MTPKMQECPIEIPEIEEAFKVLQEVSEDSIARENYRSIMDGKRNQICAMNARVRIAREEEQEKNKKEEIESASRIF